MQRREFSTEVMADMMQAIFEDDYDKATHDALALVMVNGAQDYYLMRAKTAAQFPGGRVVLIVNGSPSDDARSEQGGRLSEGMLNMYELRLEKDGWNVLERHEGIAKMGSSGDIGGVSWVTIGRDRPGFIVSFGGTWQGSTIRFANVFDLADGVLDLGGFAEYSSTAGACTSGSDGCWEVGSNIRFVDSTRPGPYGDIEVEFKGRYFSMTSNKDGDDIAVLKSKVRQTARYQYNGKSYILVSGSNPVPNI
jgi:hypothetical protein